MKKMILVGMVVLLILAISCNGKASPQSGVSTSSGKNSDDGKVSATTALRAFQQTKKVDREVVPDVEAIVKAMQGLSTSVITELTQENASPLRNFSYDLTIDGKGVSIREYHNKTPVVIVPETIEGIPVTEIQSGAFWLSDSIAIVLPETITKIGVAGHSTTPTIHSTFPSSIVIVNFPSALIEIGPSSFAFTNLITAHLPEGLQILGEKAFTYCENLTTVTLPSSLKEIGREAFYYSQNLTSAHLPEGLNELGSRAFLECRSLSKLTLPSNLRVIPRESFRRTGIIELIIPEGVEIIDAEAFCQCFRLLNVTLPSTIKEIRSSSFDSFGMGGAFMGCSNLTEIIIPDGVISIAFIYAYSSYTDRPAIAVFKDCGKIKLTVRQRLKELGYTGVF